MSAILEVKGLSVRLGERCIVKGVDFAAEEGTVTGIIGESGSGKSVFLRTVLGLLPETWEVEGEISFRGRALSLDAKEEMRRLRREEIGLIVQDPLGAFDPRRKIGRTLYEEQEKKDKGKIFALLREMGFSSPERIFDAYPYALSGGMLQRALMAVALLKGPRLLLADEPTTALDKRIQEEILLLLQRLQESHHLSLVIVSHDLRLIGKLCSRVYVMYKGQIVEWGRADEVLNCPLHPYTNMLLQARMGFQKIVSQEANPFFLKEKGDLLPSSEDVLSWSEGNLRPYTPTHWVRETGR